MKKLLIATMLVFTGSANAWFFKPGVFEQAMTESAKDSAADAKRLEAEWKEWRKHKSTAPSIEVTRRYILPQWLKDNQMDLNFSDDQFTTELFTYVLADRQDEISWSPDQIALLDSRTRACGRAEQNAANALIDMAANINTPRTGPSIVRFEAARLARAGSCNGVRELTDSFNRAIAAGIAITPKKLEIE
jgi:hypothetical protein